MVFESKKGHISRSKVKLAIRDSPNQLIHDVFGAIDGVAMFASNMGDIELMPQFMYSILCKKPMHIKVVGKS